MFIFAKYKLRDLFVKYFVVYSVDDCQWSTPCCGLRIAIDELDNVSAADWLLSRSARIWVALIS